MPTSSSQNDVYAATISRIAELLANGHADQLADDLNAPTLLQPVRMFIAANLCRRLEYLEHRLEFLAEGFDDFGELLVMYVKALPAPAVETATDDAERFLEWVEKTRPLSPEQGDYVACQRHRHAVLELACRNRMSYLRFQELLEMTDAWGEDLETNRNLQVHVNPVRVWTKLQTNTLLNAEAPTPAQILCFAADSEIRLAFLEEGGLQRFRELAAIGPCTIDEWLKYNTRFAGNQSPPRQAFVELCRELARMGLVAFG